MLKVECLSGSWNRAIVIGDIHGCLKELKAMLRKTKFSNNVIRKNPTILDDAFDANTLLEASSHTSSSSDDLCVFVGDIVNKGPDSYGCVRLLRAIGAVGVMGNHDLKLLTIRKNLGNPSYDETKSSLYSLAKDCPVDVFEYLNGLPHIIRIPQFQCIIVHAGLDPSARLDQQDIEAVTRMRRLQYSKGESSKDSLFSSENFNIFERGKEGTKWFKLWKEVMNNKTRSFPLGETFYDTVTVIYGHDAKSSLQEHKHTIGLDTGCAYGRSLSAVELPSRRIVEINCSNLKL